MSTKHILYTLLVPVILALILVGCSSDYDVVEQGSISPGDAVPAPANEVVLTLTGEISVTNFDDSLAFDINTLEKLRLVEYDVDDPWLHEKVTYRGVLLSDLLKVAGTPDTVEEVMASALDGYAAPIPISEIPTLTVSAMPVIVPAVIATEMAIRTAKICSI